MPKEEAGPLQTCAGHAEAAVHAMKEMFGGDECEAALLANVLNAFNCVNLTSKPPGYTSQYLSTLSIIFHHPARYLWCTYSSVCCW